MAHSYETIKAAGGDTATPLNLQKRLKLMANWIRPEAGALLDCGCGAGEYVAAFIDDYGLRAEGLEYLQDKVAQAKASNPHADHVQQGDIEAIQFPDQSFDYALVNEVLEHVPNESKALKEVNRILRNKGRLFLFSPNRWYPFETHGVFLKRSNRKLPPYTPFIPWLPVRLGKRWIHYWARNYWPRELAALVRGAGFQVLEHTYIWQTFENISGTQPAPIRVARPMLRAIAQMGERMPLVRHMGCSQVIIAEKV